MRCHLVAQPLILSHNTSMKFILMVASYFAMVVYCAGSVIANNPVEMATKVPIRGTALEIELLPINNPAHANVLLGKTEVPWELLDAFVFSRDAGSGPIEADAVARPSKPYISMDRGFGHAGFPAISVSDENARQFCIWLSAKTGKKFRLPTQKEFQAACENGSNDSVSIEEIAWHKKNSGGKTHRVATSKPMINGFYDLKGNAAEWVTCADGKCALVGGAYNDTIVQGNCAEIRNPTPAWNATDPQIPPSRWWLADGSFAGFRVACEVDLPSSTQPAALNPNETKPNTGK